MRTECSKKWEIREDMNFIQVKSHFLASFGILFSNKGILNRYDLIHTGGKPFPCQYCRKHFKSVGNKARHERNHSGEKLFSCTFCGQTFFRQSKHEHERIHTGEKPICIDQKIPY